ncbi:MAG: hypothetical protein JWN44_5496, partial [Myxococcales bacterium]|nr:hypothetical protein [Myxococcales bacterium]
GGVAGAAVAGDAGAAVAGAPCAKAVEQKSNEVSP